MESSEEMHGRVRMAPAPTTTATNRVPAIVSGNGCPTSEPARTNDPTASVALMPIFLREMLKTTT